MKKIALYFVHCIKTLKVISRACLVLIQNQERACHLRLQRSPTVALCYSLHYATEVWPAGLLLPGLYG